MVSPSRLPTVFWHTILLLEAAYYLLCARLLLPVLPFRWFVWFFERPTPQPEITGTERTRRIAAVRLAIERACRLLPVSLSCFPRAIAAQSMLRRQHIGTVLYYGALSQPGDGLIAHVWVQDGRRGVIGHLNAAIYPALAHFPKAK